MDRKTHDKRMIEQSRKIQRAHERQSLSKKGKLITPKQIEILKTIEEFPDVGNKELMVIMGITISTLKDHLVALQIRDLIKFKSGFRGLKSYRVNKSNMRKIMLIN